MGPPYKQGAGPTPFTQQRSALISWKGSLYRARSACGCVLSRSENRVTGVRAVAGVNYASEIQKEGEEYGKEQSQQALILDKSPAFRLSPVTTFEAIAVALVALLPGGLYVWGFERQVGNWGIGLSDRLFRFFGTSALFHAVIAPVTYWLWATQFRTGGAGVARPLPLWLWPIILAYVAMPFIGGDRVGLATRNGQGWARLLTGPDPAPRAWDYFFASRPDGWVRLRLKSGVWIGGAYAPSDRGIASYAAGYPETQDLFLAETVEMDPDSGEFLLENGRPVFRGTSLLIRWDEVEFLEFSDA